MALEGLKNFFSAVGCDVKDGVVGHAVEGTKGVVGGVLDATLGSVGRTFRGALDVIKHGFAGPANALTRIISAYRSFTPQEQGPVITRPFKAIGHLLLGAEKAAELTVVETARSVMNTCTDLGVNAVRSAFRVAGGVFGQDIANCGRFPDGTFSTQMESLGDGVAEITNAFHRRVVDGSVGGSAPASLD